jgi:serine/threonine-protein kinase
MGEIYLARLRSAEGVERPVAIKVLLPALARDEEIASMFVNEARIAARLSHPNICQVFELGRDDAELFICMEFLEGVPLTSILKSRTPDTAVDPTIAGGLIVQACAGLHHAHELCGDDGEPLGVVHRDISPANVFLTKEGLVKILDFGVVKARDTVHKTRTGALKGKYAYMSPEQLFSMELDRRADVFALGIVLFELLTNRQLFARENEYETLKAITEHPYPSLSVIRKDLPLELARVVDRALARDREERYPDCEALANAVAGAMRDLGGVASGAVLSTLVRTDHGEEIERTRRALRSSRDSELIAAVDLEPSDIDRTAETVAITATARGDANANATGPMPQLQPQRSKGLVVGMILVSLALIAVAGAIFVRGAPKSAPAEIVYRGDLKPEDGYTGGPDQEKEMNSGEAPAESEAPAVEDAGKSHVDTQPSPAGRRRRKGGKCASLPSLAARNKCSVNSHAVAFHRCLEDHAKEISGSPELILRFTLAPSGELIRTELSPQSAAETRLGRCVVSEAGKIRFSEQGRPVTFKIPLKIRKR